MKFRLLSSGIALSAALIFGTRYCAAADVWGGSLGLTSDYLVRGISRSNDRAALQLDVHYLNSTGFVAGLFASNSQINPRRPSGVELDGFLGLTWSAGSDWRGRALLSHYAYPWNRRGSAYDYDELDVSTTYQEWLTVGAVYSPNAPRYLYYRGFVAASSESAEISLQRPVLRRLSASLGAGYSHFEGPDPDGYAYWSAGAAYDLAPVSLSLAYVGTAGANTLFYNAAGGGVWTGTVIWRF